MAAWTTISRPNLISSWLLPTILKNAEIEEIKAADDEEKVLANPEEHELIITASYLEDNTAAGDSVFCLHEDNGILYDFLKHSPEMLQLLHCASGYGDYPEEFKHEEFVDESELLGLIEAASAEINPPAENPPEVLTLLNIQTMMKLLTMNSARMKKTSIPE